MSPNPGHESARDSAHALCDAAEARAPADTGVDSLLTDGLSSLRLEPTLAVGGAAGGGDDDDLLVDTADVVAPVRRRLVKGSDA